MVWAPSLLYLCASAYSSITWHIRISREPRLKFHLCHTVYTSHLVHLAGTRAVWDPCHLAFLASCRFTPNPFLPLVTQANSEWCGTGTVLLHPNKCFAIKAESYFRLFALSITTQLFFSFPHSWRMNYCSTTDKRKHWAALKRYSFRILMTILSSSGCLYQVLQKMPPKWL